MRASLLVRRKKEARSAHETSAKAQKLHGLKAKLYNKKRHAEKVQMKKTYVHVFHFAVVARALVWAHLLLT